MASRNHKIVVLGAGISGLACAYGLKRSGFDVLVIESADRVGGVMQTKIEDGFLCEAGPNSFQNSPEIMDLIEEIGLSSQLATASSGLPRYIFYRGRLHVAPTGPAGLISTKLLSASAKIRIFREPWASPNPDGHEESVAEFVARRFGPEVLRNFVAPFVSGIYAGDPDRLSAQSTFPFLIEFERNHGSVLNGFIRSARSSNKPRRRRQLCSFHQGLHTLPRSLAARIGNDNIWLSAKTTSIAATAHEGKNLFSLRILTPQGARELFADSVLFAATAYQTAEIVAPLSRTLSRELASIEYPPLAGICLAYKKTDVPRLLNGFGFLAPRDEGVRSLGCIWSSTLFPGRAPSDWHLLTIFIGGATDVEVAALSDGTLIDAAQKDLRTTLGITGAPKAMAIYRHKHAIPQYNVGHEARLQRMEAELRKNPGLFLAGNYLRGVSAGDCVKQANDLVARLCKSQPYSGSHQG